MLRAVGVSGLVVLSLWLARALSIGNCVDRFRCFDQVYHECNDTSQIEIQPLAVSISARRDATVDLDRFSQLVSGLVCHHLNASTSQSLCWYLATSNTTQLAECNSTLAEVSVLEVVGEGVVKPALALEDLLALLRSSDAFFALAGFHVNITEGQTGMGTGNGLYDVPLLSWICVALGIAASFILLTKPVWWDRLISRCWKKCRQ